MQWIKPIYHYFLPSLCLLCRSATRQLICQDCSRDLPWQAEKLVPASPDVNSIISPFYYHPPIDYLIHQYKFNKQLAYGRVLTAYLQDFILAQDIKLPQALIPVPLHHKRLAERGFNQAVEITRPIAKQLKLPYLVNTIKRVRHTPAQSLLKRSERLINLKQAFKITQEIPYQHIAIVDDVITTQTTINTLAALLKKHGVATIDVWVLAMATDQAL